MAGNFESTLSLQMQSDTKDVRAQLAQVSAEFASLSKTVQQINVSLVGLTPATQEFLKNLQSVSASAKDSRTAMAGMASVDVSKAFTTSQEASKGLESDLSRLGKSAQTSGDSLGAVGTQTQDGVTALDALRGSVVSTSGDMDSFKATMAEMVAAQREQTAVMRELASSMENMRQNGVKLDESNKSWIATIKDWVMAAYFTVGTYNQVNTAVDSHRAKLEQASVATDNISKNIQVYGQALENTSQKLGLFADDLGTVIEKFSDFKKSQQESRAEIEKLQLAFDNWALSLGDSVESGLSRASKAIREFIDNEKELPTENAYKETITWTQQLKSAWEEWVNSFSSEAVKWPTLMKPISESERLFLEEHQGTWETIKEVTDDYSSKFEKEMPENMRRAYLTMRQGIQPEIYAMIETAAAAGQSIDQISKDVKDKFGAEVAGQLGAYFTKMSTDIHESFGALSSDIQYVIPLKERLAKAGNIDAEQTKAIYKEYNAEIAAQGKAAEAAAWQMVPFTKAQMDQAKGALDAAKATQEKARSDLAAAEAAGQSSKEMAGLKKAFEEAYNATGEAQKKYDAFGKALSDAAEGAVNRTNDSTAAIKKMTDEMKSFAESSANVLGISASKMAGFLQAIYQGDSRIKADMPAITAQITAQQTALNSFRQQVASGAYATADALISAAKQTAESLGGTIEEQRKFMGDALKAIVADQKTIVDAQNKAVQDSVKNMQDVVGAAFTALKQQTKDAMEAATQDIQQHKSDWHDALSSNQNDVRLAEHEFDAYSDSLKKATQEMSTQATLRFGQIRQAISSAMDAGDSSKVEGLKKGLADFAQNSLSNFEKLGSEVAGTYKTLKDAHKQTIDAMEKRETEFAKARQATEDLIYSAVNNVATRTLNAKELYQKTITDIETTRAEADRLMAQGDAESRERAIALYKENIQREQTLKAVRMTKWDALSVADKEYYTQQLGYLDGIEQKTEEQQAQYAFIQSLKKGTLTYVSEEFAQQQALNNISIDANKLQEAQNAKQSDERTAMQDQLAIQNQQMEVMRQHAKAIEGMVSLTKEQVNFALDTSQAQKKIEALTEVRTMQVDFDTNAGKAMLDQVLGPRTIPINFEIQDNGAFRIEAIPRFSKGGFMPGYGGGDRNLIAVEDGEYIQPKEAVSFWGIQFMEAIRSMKPIHAYSTGGFVAPSYDHVNRALYAATNRIRGFKDGGLVTGGNGSSDYSGLVADAVRQVSEALETTYGAQLDRVAERYQQSIAQQDDVNKRQSSRFNSAVSNLETTLGSTIDVSVKVQADGTGTAKVGSWDRRG